MQKVLVFVFVLVQSIALSYAQQRSAEEAMRIAKEFAISQQSTVNSQRLKKASQNLKVSYTAKRGNTVCYYVINNPEGGWMIVSGDGVTTTDILAYSDEGSFDINKVSPGAKDMLMQYENEIVYAISQQSSFTIKPQNRKTVQPKHADRHDIAPLTSAKWGQDMPFNSYCPRIDNQYSQTGCVATAMAQIMYSFRFPERGSFTKRYPCASTYGYLSSDFNQHTYEWDNMIDYYSGYTVAQASAVAQLMYDCGVSVEMEYHPGASAATTENVCTAMPRYFGYDDRISYQYKTDYTDADWADLMYEEVAAGRPVLYAANDDNNYGHAFILDGYQAITKYFRFNMGWNGQGSGYYQIGNITSTYHYANNNRAVIGIQPDARRGSVADLSTAYYIKHVPSGLYLSFTNLSTGTDAGDIALRAEGTPVYLSSENNGWYYINTASDLTGQNLGVLTYNAQPTAAKCEWLFYKGSTDSRFYLYQEKSNFNSRTYYGYLGADGNTAGSPLYCNKGGGQEFEFVPCDAPEPVYTTYSVVTVPSNIGGITLSQGNIVKTNGQTFELDHDPVLGTDYTLNEVSGYSVSSVFADNTITVTYTADTPVVEPTYTTTQLTVDDILAMSDNETKTVVLASPSSNLGYYLGYNSGAVGAIAWNAGDADNLASAAGNANYRFSLKKVSGGYTLTSETGNVSLGYSGQNVLWNSGSTVWTVSEITQEIGSTTGNSTQVANAATDPTLLVHNLKQLIRFTGGSNYLNAQQTVSSLKLAAGVGGWSVWCVFEVDEDTPEPEPEGLKTGQPYRLRHETSNLLLSLTELTHSTGGFSVDNVSLRNEGTIVYLTEATDGKYYINTQPDNTGNYLYAYKWDAVPYTSATPWTITEVADGKYTLSQQSSANTGYLGSDDNTVGAALYCDKNTAQRFIFEEAELPAPTTVDITLGSSGWATFASEYVLDLTEITETDPSLQIFFCSGKDDDSNDLIMEPLTGYVPSGTGVFVVGASNTTYTIPVVEDDGYGLDGYNYLVAVLPSDITSGTTLHINQTETRDYEERINYILQEKTNGLKFYKVKADGGNNVAVNHAYLSLPANPVHPAKEYYDINIEGKNPTDISHVENVANVGNCYDLIGRKINDQRSTVNGILIVNGKKILKK